MDTSHTQPPNEPIDRSRRWLPIPVITAIAACTVLSVVALLGDVDAPVAAEKTPYVPPRMTVDAAYSDPLPTGLRQIYYEAAVNYDYDNWPASTASIVPGYVASTAALAGLDKVEGMNVVDDKREVYFGGWHEGRWDDLKIGRAMHQYVETQDDGTHMLRTLVAQQSLILGGIPDTNGVYDEDTLTITVTRFETAVHARHYMLAVLGEFSTRSEVDDEYGMTCLLNQYDNLGEVNFVRRIVGEDNPNGYYEDLMINFIRKNLIITIELTQLTDDDLASPAEIAYAIDASIGAITPLTHVNVDGLRPTINVAFSKPEIYVGSSKTEESLALLLRANYCAMEIDIGTAASGDYIHGVGFTETTILHMPVVGGTPGVVRSAYEPGEFPIAVWALDTSTMVPNVLVVWVTCLER